MMIDLHIMGISRVGKVNEYIFLQSVHPFEGQLAVTIYKVQNEVITFFALHLFQDLHSWSKITDDMLISSDLRLAYRSDFKRVTAWLEEIFRNETTLKSHSSLNFSNNEDTPS